MKTTHKQINTIADRVQELMKECFQWFRKKGDAIMEAFPMKLRDGYTPKSVRDFTIGSNKVEKTLKYTHPKTKKKELRNKPINETMTYTISPFKKIKQHLNLFIIIIIALAVVVIASCGSDDPVSNGNNNPPPTTYDTILTLDTFMISGSGIVFQTTTQTSMELVKTVKVEFTTETNCDTSDQHVTATIMSIDTVYRRISNLDSLNRTYTFTFSRSTAVGAWVYLGLGYTSSVNRYFRFVNVKVYKID